MTHQTVFLHLAVDYLQVKKDAWYLDATFGGGGHSLEILSRGGKVLAFEYDSVTYEQIKPSFQEFIDRGRLILLNQNFAKLQKVVAALPEFASDFRFA
ncbi:MAG: 16S rRNA (cytosine(1402)-N(4))-methyltransferase, partial [Candidatus Moranbacteria bacterium]|nr:16S rRNA (cytosine(1402)-N(4))-methyltransferase [Candidatus Moranbacteria bacterium]